MRLRMSVKRVCLLLPLLNCRISNTALTLDAQAVEYLYVENSTHVTS